ncbi:hypothetical protein ASZ90_016825 [hydrocarbon metagenome]|uniref:Uncharacterized protein n=1 Tax=hydrocarbon metagenome TaxID=938273 RepID=A0A0W8EB64_9ZZZZ
MDTKRHPVPVYRGTLGIVARFAGRRPLRRVFFTVASRENPELPDMNVR